MHLPCRDVELRLTDRLYTAAWSGCMRQRSKTMALDLSRRRTNKNSLLDGEAECRYVDHNGLPREYPQCSDDNNGSHACLVITQKALFSSNASPLRSQASPALLQVELGMPH